MYFMFHDNNLKNSQKWCLPNKILGISDQGQGSLSHNIIILQASRNFVLIHQNINVLLELPKQDVEENSFVKIDLRDHLLEFTMIMAAVVKSLRRRKRYQKYVLMPWINVTTFDKLSFRSLISLSMGVIFIHKQKCTTHKNERFNNSPQHSNFFKQSNFWICKSGCPSLC